MNVKRRTWFVGGGLIVIIVVGVVVSLMLSRSDGTSTTVAKGQATAEVARGDISEGKHRMISSNCPHILARASWHRLV